MTVDVIVPCTSKTFFKASQADLAEQGLTVLRMKIFEGGVVGRGFLDGAGSIPIQTKVREDILHLDAPDWIMVSILQRLDSVSADVVGR